MISKQQTPKIRFKGFSEDWVQKKLSDVLKIKSGLSQKEIEVADGIYPILATGGEIGRTNTALYSKESVLIGRKGTIDKPYYMNTPFWTVDTLFYSELSEPVSGLFIFTLFQKIQWRKLDTSTGVPSLTSSTIHNIIANFPTKTEQTAIGNLFQNIDQTIALQRRKHEQTQTLKKSLLSKMVPQKGQKQPEIRLNGFSGDWVEVKLEDVVEIVGGGTPDTNNPHFWNGDIDWYSPTEIGKQVYADKSVKTITELGLLKSSAQILPANKTVLFTSRAGIGDMAILRKDGATNQGFQSFIAKDIDIYFLYSMGSILKEKAIKKSSGSTFLEISKNQLKVIELLIPSDKSEQTAIGQFFKQLDDTLSLQAKQLKTLDNLKQALLAKMFV